MQLCPSNGARLGFRAPSLLRISTLGGFKALCFGSGVKILRFQLLFGYWSEVLAGIGGERESSVGLKSIRSWSS